MEKKNLIKEFNKRERCLHINCLYFLDILDLIMVTSFTETSNH